MALSNTLFKQLLGVNKVIIENIREEPDPSPNGAGWRLVIDVRPYSRDRKRCPVCGRKCPGCDKPAKPRLWRCPDCNGIRTFLSYTPCRVRCPEHGAKQEALPWAAPATAFTKDFTMLAALMAMRLSRQAAAELMRIDWSTAQACIDRARNMIEPDPRVRYEGLVHIGIDETSYAKGHKYLTTVVNHDTDTVVWAADGHDAATLSSFFEELTEEQRAGIKCVTADAAKWIKSCVEKYCPNAKLCLDAFHVIEWALDAVDEVRRSEWNALRDAAAAIESKLAALPPGTPEEERGKLADEMARKKEAALKIKGVRFALGKNPENLSFYQRQKLEYVVENSPALTCAHKLKELVRLVFHAGSRDEAEDAFEEFSLVARISKLKPFEKLGESLRDHWESIMNTIEQGLSNARIEANNNKIKLMIRKAFGFRVMEHLFSIIMLGCSNLRIPLPNRGGFAMKAF